MLQTWHHPSMLQQPHPGQPYTLTTSRSPAGSASLHRHEWYKVQQKKLIKSIKILRVMLQVRWIHPIVLRGWASSMWWVICDTSLLTTLVWRSQAFLIIGGSRLLHCLHSLFDTWIFEYNIMILCDTIFFLDMYYLALAIYFFPRRHHDLKSHWTEASAHPPQHHWR